jgi:hypothetical protein
MIMRKTARETLEELELRVASLEKGAESDLLTTSFTLTPENTPQGH